MVDEGVVIAAGIYLARYFVGSSNCAIAESQQFKASISRVVTGTCSDLPTIFPFSGTGSLVKERDHPKFSQQL